MLRCLYCFNISNTSFARILIKIQAKCKCRRPALCIKEPRLRIAKGRISGKEYIPYQTFWRRLSGSASLNEPDYEKYHGCYQKDMDQTSESIGGYESDKPQD
jgi:hypothetical protein